MRAKAVAALLLSLPVFAAACGRLTDDGTGGPGSIDHPTGANLVLRVEYVGGFVPQEYLLRRFPSISLYGDGRIVTEGPQIEIYPGPALPNLLVRTVNEAGTQAILAAAREAGLMSGDADYPYPCVADAATTRFTVVAEGRTSVVSAYALGLDEMGCRDVDLEARAKLSGFSAKLGGLDAWLPEGSLGAETQFVPSASRVYVQPYAKVQDPALGQKVVEWPLPSSLGGFGVPVEGFADVRCGVVRGQDADTLLGLAREANQLTPWESGGERFGLILRPLLPDESGC